MAKSDNKLESRSTKAISKKPPRKFPYNRKLKVRKGYYYYQYGDFCPRPCRAPESVPHINIQGYWLKEAGFALGTPLNVKITKGRIVVSVDSV